MRYIDLHCDTLTELRSSESLRMNERSVNLSELKEAQVLVQCCSMFVPTGYMDGRESIEAECNRIYDTYKKELKDNEECLRKILSYEDIEACMADGKTGIMLTIEDAGVLFGSMDNLIDMYDKGVRLVTLTWNHENELAYPNSTQYSVMSQRLKVAGHVMVERMMRIGIIVDVSHLSDGGFYDVVDISRRLGKPFVASHSNARTITNHPRNLADDMIRYLADCGGVMGLNLAPHFLNNTQAPNGYSRVEDMVEHVLHIRNVGGSDILSIGSDFDGIEGKLEIGRPTEFVKLWDALKAKGIPESELDKMWQLNALRVFKDVLQY